MQVRNGKGGGWVQGGWRVPLVFSTCARVVLDGCGCETFECVSESESHVLLYVFVRTCCFICIYMYSACMFLLVYFSLLVYLLYIYIYIYI